MAFEYFRRVIRISAEDSPNVQLARAQQAAGIEPTGERVVPGVLTWDEYRQRLATWDEVRQCIGLRGEFWTGREALLFPPAWLDHAAALARGLVGHRRVAEAVGIDTAEGGDRTAMAAVDRLGLIELVSKRTPDTSVIRGEAIGFGRRHGVPPERWVFDAGGGGKEHADYLRADGCDVQTVGFGEACLPEIHLGMRLLGERIDNREERAAWDKRRAQMYAELSALLDPSAGPGWAIAEGELELRRQLAPMPRLYDGEGRLWLPPKSRKDPNSKVRTLREILGCSPDEADAVVLAVHGMVHEGVVMSAGAS